MKYVLSVGLGLPGGYLYYRFVGCSGNSCPITSNPWSTMAYGALMGLIVVWK